MGLESSLVQNHGTEKPPCCSTGASEPFSSRWVFFVTHAGGFNKWLVHQSRGGEKNRQSWFVTIDGVRRNLGKDRKTAFRKFHELMAQPQRRAVASESVVSLIDAFLDWTQKDRAERTYDWYRERLQWFVSFIPAALTVSQLKPFHVQNWIDGKECSDGHKRGCVTAVMRSMNWSAKMGYID